MGRVSTAFIILVAAVCIGCSSSPKPEESKVVATSTATPAATPTATPVATASPTPSPTVAPTPVPTPAPLSAAEYIKQRVEIFTTVNLLNETLDATDRAYGSGGLSDARYREAAKVVQSQTATQLQKARALRPPECLRAANEKYLMAYSAQEAATKKMLEAIAKAEAGQLAESTPIVREAGVIYREATSLINEGNRLRDAAQC